MRNSETLKDALIRVGDEEHLAHLTKEAQKLTKKDITAFLNNKIDDKHFFWEGGRRMCVYTCRFTLRYMNTYTHI